DLDGALDVLVDEQDRLAFARQLLDQVVDERGDARLDSGGGLVDQEQGRIVHKAARDLELALLPAAQGARGLSAPLPQYGEALVGTADQLLDTSGLAPVAPGAQPQVHLDGEVRKDAGALREIDDAVPAHLVRPDRP